MRKNYPVHDRQYPVHSHQTLISITDLKGRITYCNDDFIAVSGFSKEEMYGKAHNIVRHPDVPKEIFKDFWQVIEKGGIWTGIIKNRRKNGDYYWVRANATALIRDGKPIGYLSVRTRPTQEEIGQAQRLYEKIGLGDEKSKYIYSNGGAVRKGLPGRLGHLIRQNLTIIQTGAPIFLALGLLLAGTYVFSLPVLIVLLFLLAYLLGRFYQYTAKVHTQTIQRVLSPLAGGDLTQFIDLKKYSNNPSILSVNQFSLAVRTVIRDVQQDLLFLRQQAMENAKAAHVLRDRALEEGQMIEQSATAAEQISSVAKRATDGAQFALRASQTAVTTTEQAEAAIDDVNQAMQAIAGSSEEMTTFIELIDSVAFQTNILALNAAVEAARAGQHGRGFAVVADEIRALAQRTASAAQEIQTLIQRNQENTSRGQTNTRQAQEIIKKVREAITQSAQVLDDMQHSVQGQLQGVNEITDALQRLTAVAERNDSLSDQMQHKARKVQENVQSTQESLSVFEIRV